LSKTLRESYTINPALQPRFTACSFDGNPPPTITWTYNGQRYAFIKRGNAMDNEIVRIQLSTFRPRYSEILLTAKHSIMGDEMFCYFSHHLKEY
jgi:hypothetical protein